MRKAIITLVALLAALTLLALGLADGQYDLISRYFSEMAENPEPVVIPTIPATVQMIKLAIFQ